MDQLLNMGFPQGLAAQALAATGGKSTLKATEWILNQRSESQKVQPVISTNASRVQHQARVDRFFQGSSQKSFSRDGIVNVLPSDHSKIIPTGNEGCGHLDNAYKIELGMKSICEDQSKGAAQLYVEEKAGPSNLGGDCLGSANAMKSIPSLLPSRESPDAEPVLKRQKLESRDSSSHTKPSIPFKFPQQSSQKAVAGSSARSSSAPLSERMRPLMVDDVVGQDHLLGFRQSQLSQVALKKCEMFWRKPNA